MIRIKKFSKQVMGFVKALHLAALLVVLALALSVGLPALAQPPYPVEGQKVFMADGAEPFAPGADTLTLTVVPLLGADCMVVQTGGQVMLVDMGKKNDYPMIRQVLESLGIERIDIAFNTHPHSDHIGSMALLAEQLPVGRFITTYPEYYTAPSVLQRSTIRALKDLSVPIETMGDGDTFTLGEAHITVMKTNFKDTNASSAMLHITFGEVRYLLAADVNRSAQRKLAAVHGDSLKADLLKYPHHGQEKLNEEFTLAVAPQFSLITHGSSNSKEGQKWLERYQAGYLFATWGVITAQTDGERVLVSQQMTEEGYRYQTHWEKNR